MAGAKRRYVKISIPEADRTVLEWLAAQDDMSTSMRYLIRQDVAVNGVTDILCRDVIPMVRKGKPSGSERLSDPLLSEQQTGKLPTERKTRSGKKKLKAKPPVSVKPVSSVSSDHSDNTEEYDVMDMLRLDQTPSKTFGTSSVSSVTDEDGIVDPEALLR